MTTNTRPTRRAPAAAAPAPARGGRTPSGAGRAGGADWMKRGEAAKQTSASEVAEAQKRREQRQQGRAFRFFLKHGEQANVIVLDATFEELPFFYEHALQNDKGKWNLFEPCVKEFASCPICEGYGQKGGEQRGSYYAMFISILDTSGYEKQDGTFVAYDRKLLVVKQGQHQEFFRIFDLAMKEHGTIRGLEMTLQREDTANASSIGKPVMMDNGRLFTMNDEDTLYEDFGHDAIVGDDGKVIVEADAMLLPYDYTKLFPRPDPDAMRRKYGAGATPGSADDVDDGWDPAGPAAGGRRSRSQAAQAAPAGRGGSRRAAPAYAPQDDGVDDDEYDEPAPAPRGGGRRSAAPAPAPARGSRAPQQAPVQGRAGRAGGFNRR